MNLPAERHPPATVLSLGEIELDLAGRRLTRRGQPVRLSRTEWRLLEELAAQAGQIVSHRALLQRVWGDAYGDEANYLHVYIRRLRHKIEADPANPRFLRSEPGIGYRLDVPRRQPAPEPAPAVPPPAAPPVASPIPAALTSLVGRRSELEQVVGLLRQPDVRLVTLAGPGGIGKTRLALAAALQLGDDFADGAALAALDAVRDPAQVAGAIIRALGLTESGAQPAAEQLRASLRERSLLLVLDNFEQVLAAAPLVSELLAAARGLKVLATSREVLRVYGEHEVRVPPLSLAAQLSGGQAEAVQLFIERARLVRPGFALSAENAAAVEAICARLEGIPLAIELAAARLRRLTPAAVLQGLTRRLMLGGGPNNAPHRQQTLRDTIAWSYMLLTEAEQRAFRQLGVAVGGCTPAAALAICATDSGAPIDAANLESLADKSLLHSLEDHDGGLRYAMLETIREYALERLADDPAGQAVRDRHLAAFLALAEQAAAGMEGPGQVGWLDTLAADNENLRAALDWGLRPDAPAAAQAQAQRLAAALGGFWELRGHWTEGRGWIGR
ncbi:MAG TPA: winged helix-turn-helix domain-containing protein, partial [Herpetosiphonaceae bacterium]|nr:winged helix-turn-helix domain-containing protein [Herpetosiphonaceae bacterium]